VPPLRGCAVVPAQVEAVGAFLFIGVVIVEFVDVAFGAQTWVALKLADDNLNGAAHCALSSGYLALVAVLNVAWVAGVATMYFFFSACPLQLVFLLSTTVINTVLFILSLAIELLWCALNPSGDDVDPEQKRWPCKTRTSPGVLPAAIVCVFNATYVYMALASEPSAACNPLSSAQSAAPVILTLLYQALVICWMCFRTASALFSCCCGDYRLPEEEGGRADDGDDDAGAGFRVNTDAPTSIIGFGKKSADRAADEEDDSWIPMAPTCACCGPRALWVHPEPYFHFAMSLGAMYLGMTLTNWGVANPDSRDGDLNLSYAAVWVKMSHVWLCSAIFLWILLAPVVCFRRDFTKELVC
jgi:hypothetical protein